MMEKTDDPICVLVASDKTLLGKYTFSYVESIVTKI